ncbi:hypothetical protein CFIMG_007579RA00001 [Ceratocystis fimbriata CBS 114723]|uniref:Uncharacterized protein n=1 Tax=Ceratocystis fimbriata CBS 114723 TaxID=1035309 RepID=A0A2C5X1W9_9PEZI|nr:hypothetical protein CFIMG_007579RA00001 [Ceratocystis fimbriata CBS 114723]
MWATGDSDSTNDAEDGRQAADVFSPESGMCRGSVRQGSSTPLPRTAEASKNNDAFRPKWRYQQLSVFRKK